MLSVAFSTAWTKLEPIATQVVLGRRSRAAPHYFPPIFPSPPFDVVAPSGFAGGSPTRP
jgi:hypothetical protein